MHKVKNSKLTSLTLILLIAFSLTNFHCKDKSSTSIFSFEGINGSTPKGTMTLVDSTIYGYTSNGGIHGKGAIFKVDDNGKNFKIVYEFEKGADNYLGYEPHHDAMLYYDNDLFGAALYGGIGDNGVIFRINSDGSNYTPIHTFTGGDSDGAHPHSGVIAKDSILFGLTAEGGKGKKGTLYRMNPDGSEFSVLYSFLKETGHNPHGRVTPGSNADILLGNTKSGGTDNLGVIFAFDLSDSSYKVLHNFTKSKDDGHTTEHGYLVRVDNKLFGRTKFGGDKDKGVIYSISEDGSDFKVIHSFDSHKLKQKDGHSPFGSLLYSNGFLYGCTQKGGENDEGTVFRITPNGNYYEILLSFDKSTSGAYPIDNVVISKDGSELYVYGQEGGEFDASGKYQFGVINKIMIDSDPISK